MQLRWNILFKRSIYYMYLLHA